MTLYVLVGVAGVGKSTWLKNNANPNDIIVSSDEIRKELFGYLSQEDNPKVFEIAYNRIKSNLEKGRDVYFDATNLRLKKRINLYNQFKKFGDVKGIVFLDTFLNIEERNNNREVDEKVPRDALIEMYKTLQIPVIGLDCDDLQVISFADFVDVGVEMIIYREINGALHHSTYHAESIDDHIKMVVAELETKTSDKDLLDAGRFHDFGKYFCKILKPNGLASFKNHENVSAQCSLMCGCSVRTAWLVQFHMLAHELSDKLIKRYKLDTLNLLDDLKLLAECDDKRKIPLENIVRTEYSGRYPGLRVLKYKNLGENFTDDIVRSCRGLVLDEKNNVILRGFEKFFNYKELDQNPNYSESFKERYDIDDNILLDCYEKRDGTMITVSAYKDNIICGTTGRLDSPYSLDAERYFSKVDGLLEYLKDNNVSLIFEYTAPDNKIVLDYPIAEYYLIGKIKNTFNAKIDHDFSDLYDFGFNIVPKTQMTLSELLDFAKHTENKEGYVVKNSNGELIKFKTEWYFVEHQKAKLFFGGLTKSKLKLLVDAYLNDTIDDIIELSNTVHKLNEETKLLPPAEIAKNEYAPFLFNLRKGRLPFNDKLLFAYLYQKYKTVEE